MKKITSKRIFLYNLGAKYFLLNTYQKFDFIFLDPPYNINILDNSIKIILKRNLLLDSGTIYIELNNLYFFKDRYKNLYVQAIEKIGNTFICLLKYKRKKN